MNDTIPHAARTPRVAPGRTIWSAMDNPPAMDGATVLSQSEAGVDTPQIIRPKTVTFYLVRDVLFAHCVWPKTAPTWAGRWDIKSGKDRREQWYRIEATA